MDKCSVDVINISVLTSKLLFRRFANHLPAKLMEHLKLFATRLNIPRLIRTCEQQQLYSELTFLYVKYDEYDNALNVMMQHGPDAWEHVRFKDVAVKCSSVDIFYKAISHYLDYHPELLSDLIKASPCQWFCFQH